MKDRIETFNGREECKQCDCNQNVCETCGGPYEECDCDDSDPITCPKCDGEGYFTPQDSFDPNQDILSIERRVTYDVCLSTGGPADGFRVTLDISEGYRPEIKRIEYYFQDWFDGATLALAGEDFDRASEAFDFLCDSEECAT